MEKDCLQRLLDEGCTEAAAFVECGTELWENGLFERAIEACDRALAIDSKKTFTYILRGAAKSKLGQNEAAILDFDRAIELDPNDATAFYNRGLVKSNLGRNEAAILDFDRAVELDLNDATVFYNRGLAKSNLGQNEAAILDFDRAIELDPNDAIAFNNRGNVKCSLGQNEAAILDFDRAIELDPNLAHAFGNRGNAKRSLKQNEAAILDFDRAIELDPNLAPGFGSRGLAKYDLDQKEAAILDLDHAIELDPNLAPAFYNRGLAKYDLGQNLEARQDFLRFLSIHNEEQIREKLSDHLRRWSTTYPAPYLVDQLLRTHSYARGYLSLGALIAENDRHSRPALLWSAWQRAGQGLAGREALWFEVFLHLGMGDPIGANRHLDLLDDSTSEDLAVQYFLQQSAEDILHPERESIRDFAVEAACALDGDDARQAFYAGRILEAAGAADEALARYRRGAAWWPAALAAAALEGKPWEKGPEGEDFSRGLPVVAVRPEAEHWLRDLEQAVLFFDLEPEITRLAGSGHAFPRFWEIWDVSALVEPLREREAVQREAWLQARFAERYSATTGDLHADASRFGHHFDVKMAFDHLRRSHHLEADLALAIGSSQLLTAEVCAALIEYFYLKRKLLAGQVFHLFFYLTHCRPGEPGRGGVAAAQGLQESQKSLLEKLLQPSLQLLGFFGDATAAGMAEFLKTLFWQLLENPAPKLLGERGETTAYERFKEGFKYHIHSKMEEMGGEDAFFKEYPVRLFVE